MVPPQAVAEQGSLVLPAQCEYYMVDARLQRAKGSCGRRRVLYVSALSIFNLAVGVFISCI